MENERLEFPCTVYLFDYKSHSSIRRTPKLGPELGTKFFHDNLKHPQELHEDTKE